MKKEGTPIHLVGDYYVAADAYCYIIKERKVSAKGEARLDNVCYPAQWKDVENFVKDICAKEYVNGDWNRMVDMVNSISLTEHTRKELA
ncbi:hypothetical protein [uncultured Mediterranean phage]|nr:hypothetical protein [uncultured Mediterranean phage]